MTEFKLGDIIEVIKEIPDRISNLRGEIGIIVCVNTWKEGNIGVEFQEDIHGHNCAGTAKGGWGWYLNPGDLKLLYRKP